MYSDFVAARKQIWATLKPGDKIKYTMRNAPAHTGFLSSNHWPAKIYLINPVNKFVWYIPLTEPTLKIWYVKKDKLKSLQAEKEKIYLLYKQGNLVLKSKQQSASIIHKNNIK